MVEKVDLFRKTHGNGDIFCRPVLEQEAWNGPVTPGPWFKSQSLKAEVTGKDGKIKSGKDSRSAGI